MLFSFDLNRIRVPLLYLFAIPLLVTACSTASIKDRAEILALADMPKKTSKILEKSEPKRKPLKPGQWVTLLIDSENGDRNLTIRTIKVIEIKNSETVIEIESQSALKREAKIEEYTIQDFPVNPIFEPTYRQYQVAINTTRFKKVRIKDGNKPIEVWPSELLLFSTAWLEKLFLVGSVPDDEKPRLESCTNSVYESERCYIFRYTNDYLEHRSAGRALMHSEIPIVGFLHVYDTYFNAKVIDYGDSGAKSALLD